MIPPRPLPRAHAAAAESAAARILDQPAIVHIRRRLANGTVVRLPPQTVRIDPTGVQRDDRDLRIDPPILALRAAVVITGLRDHPLYPDCDLQRGDRFVRAGREYSVIAVDPAPGCWIATAEARA